MPLHNHSPCRILLPFPRRYKVPSRPFGLYTHGHFSMLSRMIELMSCVGEWGHSQYPSSDMNLRNFPQAQDLQKPHICPTPLSTIFMCTVEHRSCACCFTTASSAPVLPHKLSRRAAVIQARDLQALACFADRFYCMGSGDSPWQRKRVVWSRQLPVQIGDKNWGKCNVSVNQSVP